MLRRSSFMNRARISAGAIVVLLSLVGFAEARPAYFAAFTSRYPDATSIAICGTCHVNFDGGGTRNPFGQAFEAAGGPSDPNAALTAIEGGDADGDATSNIDEITTATGFFPGWTCDTYLSAVNAPGNLANFVDPANPGCLNATTTTSTTSPATTSTTLPIDLRCAQPISSGTNPLASDCLFILGVSVGTRACTPNECVCDPSGDGKVVATDALLCLNAAVGNPATLDCPCG